MLARLVKLFKEESFLNDIYLSFPSEEILKFPPIVVNLSNPSNDSNSLNEV